jgi:hypothetical protein
MRNVMLIAACLAALGARAGQARPPEAETIRLTTEAYPATFDELTQRPTRFGRRIVLHLSCRPVDPTRQGQRIERSVPILALCSPGRHAPGQAADRVTARAEAVAGAVRAAFGLLYEGGRLRVRGGTDGNDPVIYAQGPLRVHPVTGKAHQVAVDVITVRASDVRTPDRHLRSVVGLGSQRELAEYWRDLLEAHYLLFVRRALNAGDYADLAICGPVDADTGNPTLDTVFHDVAVKARAFNEVNDQLYAANIAEVLADDSPYARCLQLLPHMPPRSWSTSFRAPAEHPPGPPDSATPAAPNDAHTSREEDSQ